MNDQTNTEEGSPARAASRAESANSTDELCGEDLREANEEGLCLVCGGEGIVEGSDHLDWDEDGYDDLITCTSCNGSGLAKDMTWC